VNILWPGAASWLQTPLAPAWLVFYLALTVVGTALATWGAWEAWADLRAGRPIQDVPALRQTSRYALIHAMLLLCAHGLHIWFILTATGGLVMDLTAYVVLFALAVNATVWRVRVVRRLAS
jgi:hypothetical protein